MKDCVSDLIAEIVELNHPDEIRGASMNRALLLVGRAGGFASAVAFESLVIHRGAAGVRCACCGNTRQ